MSERERVERRKMSPTRFASQGHFEAGVRLALRKGKEIPYKKTGTDIYGMSPTHYVHWTFARIGWHVPADIEIVARMGKLVSAVKELRSGDVMFFSTKKKGVATLMGVYRGKGQFACVLPLKGKRGGWALTPITHPFFAKRFLFARRLYPNPVVTDETPPRPVAVAAPITEPVKVAKPKADPT